MSVAYPSGMPGNRGRYDGRSRRRGREVRQRPAKPRTAVRVRSSPSRIWTPAGGRNGVYSESVRAAGPAVPSVLAVPVLAAGAAGATQQGPSLGLIALAPKDVGGGAKVTHQRG